MQKTLEITCGFRLTRNVIDKILEDAQVSFLVEFDTTIRLKEVARVPGGNVFMTKRYNLRVVINTGMERLSVYYKLVGGTDG